LRRAPPQSRLRSGNEVILLGALAQYGAFVTTNVSYPRVVSRHAHLSQLVSSLGRVFSVLGGKHRKTKSTSSAVPDGLSFCATTSGAGVTLVVGPPLVGKDDRRPGYDLLSIGHELRRQPAFSGGWKGSRRAFFP